MVELGAGTGLAGMVAAMLGAARVDVTDGDERVLELVRRPHGRPRADGALALAAWARSAARAHSEGHHF